MNPESINIQVFATLTSCSWCSSLTQFRFRLFAPMMTGKSFHRVVPFVIIIMIIISLWWSWSFGDRLHQESQWVSFGHLDQLCCTPRPNAFFQRVEEVFFPFNITDVKNSKTQCLLQKGGRGYVSDRNVILSRWNIGEPLKGIYRKS